MSSIAFNLNVNSGHQSFDRRRFTGPDSSTSLPIPSRLPPPSTSTSIRPDARLSTDLRPIHIQTGVVSSANGSSYVETKNLKVLCAVFGPKPRPASFSPTASPLLIHYSFAPFALRPTPAGTLRPSDTHLAHALHQALAPSLRPTPNEIVDLHLAILDSDDPQPLAHSILAGSLALAAAGVPSNGLVIGLSAALTSDSQLLIDPTGSESAEAAATITLASIPAMASLTFTSVQAATGSVPINSLLSSLDVIRDSSALIHPLAIDALQKDLQRAFIV